MRRKVLSVAFWTVTGVVSLLSVSSGLLAQIQPPPAPWRGAGPTPCLGIDAGYIQCPPAALVVAVRAGRLFDSKTGQMLTKQVILLQGDRITAVGPEAQVKIPAGAQVISVLIRKNQKSRDDPKSGHD